MSFAATLPGGKLPAMNESRPGKAAGPDFGAYFCRSVQMRE